MLEANGQENKGELFLRRKTMLYKFDTKVQYLKYKVLREVARHAWDDTLLDNLLEIPKTIVPGNTPASV